MVEVLLVLEGCPSCEGRLAYSQFRATHCRSCFDIHMLFLRCIVLPPVFCAFTLARQTASWPAVLILSCDWSIAFPPALCKARLWRAGLPGGPLSSWRSHACCCKLVRWLAFSLCTTSLGHVLATAQHHIPHTAGSHPSFHCLQKVTQYALYYMDAQRVGTLPANNEVSYRSNALVYEENIGPANGDISGGWIEGGALGNLKMTVPTAFSTSLLAWGLIAFPKVSPLGVLNLCSRNPKMTVPTVLSIGLLAGGLIAVLQISYLQVVVVWQLTPTEGLPSARPGFSRCTRAGLRISCFASHAAVPAGQRQLKQAPDAGHQHLMCPPSSTLVSAYAIQPACISRLMQGAF